MGTNILKILILLAMGNYMSVKVITADIYPKEKNITYNQSATFSCTASDVTSVIFVVADVDTSMWASRGISLSASTYSGSNTTTTLTVEGIKANNGLQITCRVFVGTIYQDISPPAVLTVKDPITSTSSSSQVSPTTTTSLTTTPNLTTTTTTSTPVPSPMMSTSALGTDVGVIIAVALVVIVVLVALGVVAIMICMYKRSKHRPSTSKITTNDIPLSPAGKGEEKGTSDIAIQIEKECNEPSHTCTSDATNDELETLIKNNSSDGMKTFATSPLTATLTHMASCDGVVVGMLTSSPQEEGSESKPSDTNTDANVESEPIIKSHQTTLKHSSTQPSSAVHRDDGSTSVPTSEGHDDVMTSPHRQHTEVAPSQETTTAQCCHEPPTSPIQSTTCQHGPPSASPLHTCIPAAPEDGEVPAGGGVVSITMEMEHGDTSSGDFATSPLSDTHTHMPSCDGVVVGMLTSSPQEEGCESKPSSDTNTGANVESDSFINNNSSDGMKTFATSPLTATLTHMSSCDGVVVGMLTSSPQEEGSESKPSSDVDVESETLNNSSDGMKTFATSPLTATLTHMSSCDGVVVGMLTSSPQEEGSESKPSSDVDVESETLNNSHQTTLQHSSTPPSSAVHRDDGSTSVPTSEGPSAALPFQTQLAAPPKDGGGGMVCITMEMEHVDTSQHDQKGD